MTIRYKTYAAYAAMIVGLAVVFAAVSHARGGEGCCGSKAATPTRPNSQSGYGAVHRRDDPTFRPPHGGQLSKMTWHQLEVVYGPQETRVYLYDLYRSPVSTRGVRGQAIMRVRSNGTEFRYPLQYVPVERGQDYLVARVDLTRVQDGDMDVHYELAGLPNREAPTAKFSQVFSMMRPVDASARQLVTAQRTPSRNDYRTGVVRQASVSVADATATDRPAVVRQQKCPVMDTALGEHGTPIKVAVDGRALFVCCRGCVDTVVKNPEFHFQKLASGGPVRFPQVSAPAKESCH